MHRLKWITSAALACLVATYVFSGETALAFPQTDDTSTQNPVSSNENQNKNADLDLDSINLDLIFSGKETPAVMHLLPMQEHFKELAQKVRPATVGIQTGGASGSGVIVSRDGYVLTAAHVISRPDVDAFIILQDGTRLKAKTLGLDHSIDSGMLKIVDEGKWPYLDMGESESLENGQWVMAIGHPGGFDEERAPPIRVGRVLANDDTVMQTDCTLVGGDSGGPLVDMEGNVIGIHSRIGGYLNQNYHVPVDTYLINWDDLVAKVEKGGRRNSSIRVRIGFSFEDDTTLEISEVADDGPAEKAGIQEGDIIYKMEGNRIRNQRVLKRELAKLKPDQTVKLVVKRGDEELEFEVTVVAK